MLAFATKQYFKYRWWPGWYCLFWSHCVISVLVLLDLLVMKRISYKFDFFIFRSVTTTLNYDHNNHIPLWCCDHQIFYHHLMMMIITAFAKIFMLRPYYHYCFGAVQNNYNRWYTHCSSFYQFVMKLTKRKSWSSSNTTVTVFFCWLNFIDDPKSSNYYYCCIHYCHQCLDSNKACEKLIGKTTLEMFLEKYFDHLISAKKLIHCCSHHNQTWDGNFRAVGYWS